MMTETQHKYLYSYRKEYHTDFGGYISYGIELTQGEYLLSYFPDVFLNEQDAVDFVNRCNEGQVEPCHIHQVIEDAII